jgi:spore photoproduct lyase
VEEGLDLGHTIRLCFDPMIHVPDWKKAYIRMMETIQRELGEERLRQVFDFSIGSFRIPQDYLRALRKSTASAVVQYPFVNVDDFYQYPPETAEEMENTMTGLLLPYAGRDRIFRWREQI